MDSISLLKLSHCAPWGCGHWNATVSVVLSHHQRFVLGGNLFFFFFLDSSSLFKPLQILNVTEPSLAQTHYHLQI